MYQKKILVRYSLTSDGYKTLENVYNNLLSLKEEMDGEKENCVLSDYDDVILLRCVKQVINDLLSDYESED